MTYFARTIESNVDMSFARESVKPDSLIARCYALDSTTAVSLLAPRMLVYKQTVFSLD